MMYFRLSGSSQLRQFFFQSFYKKQAFPFVLSSKVYSACGMSSLWLSRFGIVLATCALTACAYSPGITMNAQAPEKSTSGLPAPEWIRFQKSNTAGREVRTGPGGLIEGVAVPITADLIRQQRAQQSTEITQDVKNLFAVSKPYAIGAGDVLNIVVWDHPELILLPAASALTTDVAGLSSVGNGFNVNNDGFIQFPYAGSVKLAGLTESQANQELTTRLSQFIKNPQLTVRIQAYRNGRVYINGEVKLPGVQSVNDIPLTLPEAIGRAGGFLATADRSAVNVTRAGRTAQVNFLQLARLGINPGNILLVNGDSVQVLSREDSQVFVLGEVLIPKALPLRNGQLTLSEALGQSGGVSQLTGDPREIFVLRSGSAGSSEIFQLDASTPAAYALAEGFDLKAKDVVFVNPSSLVRFNRVINLLLPGAVAANATSGIAK
jgi:polysaccharide export outer membrane protein